MASVFGVPWADLELDHLISFLEENADDEPLLWEAKGNRLDAKEVRRQVAGFANSHEGGYLLLGVSYDKSSRSWRAEGVRFPDEPRLWVTNVVTDAAVGVRPVPTFDVKAWSVGENNVAVVRVEPTSTPPCITNGTVYERRPGSTPTVQDPQRLAELFGRGEQARLGAEERARLAAGRLWSAWLHPAAAEAVNGSDDDEVVAVTFALGVASTGVPEDIAGRLFVDELVDKVWERLRRDWLPPNMPQNAIAPDPVDWSQASLTWRLKNPLDRDLVICVQGTWDASLAIGAVFRLQMYPDRLAQRLPQFWSFARDILVNDLGGFGDLYLTLHVGGDVIGPHGDGQLVEMRRGPLQADDNHAVFQGLGRELSRAVGNYAAEPGDKT